MLLTGFLACVVIYAPIYSLKCFYMGSFLTNISLDVHNHCELYYCPLKIAEGWGYKNLHLTALDSAPLAENLTSDNEGA